MRNSAQKLATSKVSASVLQNLVDRVSVNIAKRLKLIKTFVFVEN